ncbi:MAG: hypothetical protein R3E64_16970 [Halioglobus sp.]
MTGTRAIDSNSGKEGGGMVYRLAAAVVLGCIVAYGLALNGPLFFDDVPNLLENPRVQIDGATFDDWRVAALSSDSGALLRPVAMLTFAMNYAAAGEFTAFSLKASNLIIHLSIGWLVYLFAQALLQAPALRGHRLDSPSRRLIAVLAASIWLLHPIHVSTVLYAVQRMAQLSMLFTLLGLLLFTRYRLRWAEVGAGTGEVIAAAIWLLLCAVFAVLSKENGALLPWLIAVVEVTLFRGIWGGKSHTRLALIGWLALLLPLVLIVVITLFVPELLPGSYGYRNFTLQERLLTQGRILWQYLSWLLVPNIVDMGFFHDDIPLSRDFWSPFTTALSLLAWCGVLLFSLLWRKRFPLTAFAFLFYLVAHSLESSVIPLEMVFEHRNYLPSVGFAVLASVGIFRCAAKFQRLRLGALAGGILSILLVLLVVRTYVWRDEVALARFEVINHPQSVRANFIYGNALFKRFGQSQALGLDAQQQQALAVTSRTYFERMHALDGQEFAALVMLYQLDSNYFPALAEQNDWLGAMETLAQTRRLSSSDRTALGALVDFALTPAGARDRDRIGRLMDRFGERYPKSLEMFAYRYKIAMASGNERKAELLPDLERVTRFNEDSTQAAAYLAQYHGTQDLAPTYEAIREWMRRDQYRRELPAIREIFNK